MYVAYGVMMVCRHLNTILSPALLADESLNITKTDIGDIAAYGTIGALVGKLIWGPLVDKIGGRLTFLIGIFVVALLATGFGLSRYVIAFAAFSFLLQATKSGGWPAMTKLIGDWYQPKRYGAVWGILSTSSRAGVVLGTLFLGWLLSQMEWRFVAFAATGVTLAVFVLCYLFMQDKPKDPDFLKNAADADADADAAAANADAEKAFAAAKAMENRLHHPLKGTTLKQGLLAFAKSPRVWLVVIMLQLLTCLISFLDFIPIYLMEVFQLTPSNAVMASSVFPLGSLLGLLASVVFYDKLPKRVLRRVLTLSLAIATLCVAALLFLPLLNLTPEQNFPVALVMILLFGIMISPAYYIPMSIFSIEFGGPHSATLVCLIDAFGYGAGIPFGFIGGRLADSAGGWSSFMTLLLVLSILATVSVWLFMRAEYRTVEKKYEALQGS